MHERANIPLCPRYGAALQWQFGRQVVLQEAEHIFVTNSAARRLACSETFLSFLFSGGGFLSFWPTTNHVAALRRSNQSEDRDSSFSDRPVSGSQIMSAASATLRAFAIAAGDALRAFAIVSGDAFMRSFAIRLRRSHLNNGDACL